MLFVKGPGHIPVFTSRAVSTAVYLLLFGFFVVVVGGGGGGGGVFGWGFLFFCFFFLGFFGLVLFCFVD